MLNKDTPWSTFVDFGMCCVNWNQMIDKLSAFCYRWQWRTSHGQPSVLFNGVKVVSDDDLPISHYSDVIMGMMASQITSLTVVYPTVYSGADQRKHQNSASLAFLQGIHRWPVNSPHKWPVTPKMIPFDDVIMNIQYVKWNMHMIWCDLFC